MMLLTIAILSLLWVLQIVSLRPYYRNMKISDVRLVASVIEEGMKSGNLSENVVQVAIANNVCAAVYNQGGNQLYFVDTLGVSCWLARSNHSDASNFILEYIDQAKTVSGTDFTFTMDGINSDREMMFYGKEVVADFTNYYVFVNAPIEPLDSTIIILQDQFVYVTIAVFILSSLMAFFISSRIAQPLASMVKSAKKLGKGDIRVSFDSKGYSEVNELAQTLNYATSEMAKMDELRKDLIANVSHDIKTPLTTIKAYAEMILELSGSNPKKRKEHLDIILSEANHLDRLVNDMMRLAQYDSPNLIIDAKDVHLKSLVNNIAQLFKGLLNETGVKLKIDVDEAIIVCVDEIKMGQVLFNFINNAIRHAGKDKVVAIKAIRKKETIRLAVIDKGDGIKEDELPYIWDRYYKIDKNFARNDNGTGLGLAIAKSICVAHEVPFGVISSEDQGSTFYVELPLV